ncbi:MAG: PEGA domain-containing protein [Candidatus Shapirobacteria bacterium]|nr:PEGA domain-containing protein [Candidatus Shapirobacteria bacterium]
MSQNPNKKSILIILIVSISIICLTFIISLIARGYKFNLKSGTLLTATGILSATSEPKGASVYLDDRLVTATDNTLNLSPDSYTVKIIKDGYLPWQKTIKIKKETVSQTDTQLFRSVPDLKPLTYTGAINPTINADGTKIVYAIASASASTDNGLFIIEFNNSFSLNLNRNTPRQLSQNLLNINWSDFNFEFSPNSRQILATNSIANISYLIPLDNTINPKNLYDVTPTLNTIKNDWKNQLDQLIATKVEKIPKELQPLISTISAQDIQLSTNEEKILYLAQKDGNLINGIITPPPAQSTQIQSRDIKQGNYYVYNLKDDTNFLIGSNQDIINPSWLANYDNILFTSQQSIKVADYDGTNQQTLYIGDFDPKNVFPTIDGSKIITLISPYQSAPENLYTISIK